MGRGNIADPLRQSLPQVEAVADLHRVRGAVGDALAVDQRAIPADHVNTGVCPQPGGQLLGVAAGPQLDRQPGVGIHQQGAVDVRVQREVVHAQHPRGRW